MIVRLWGVMGKEAVYQQSGVLPVIAIQGIASQILLMILAPQNLVQVGFAELRP
jgi:hypothetical protein